MNTRIRTPKEEHHIYEVHFQPASFSETERFAKEHCGSVITLKELATNPEVMSRLEGKHIWLADKGTKLEGHYEIREGSTTEEVFNKVTKEEFDKLPVEKKASFYPGNNQLTAYIVKLNYRRRLHIVGDYNASLHAQAIALRKPI
ncbi:MAG: hypothetical protein KGH64_04745 [Candidatus Micrarchaeota archaeon]|nr:hypothetical protein [Candidatus Micrarchaeota archaeon]MDE1834620.1 hypothetical protein [Candidatus Micrarchaeota archaeon]MDE1859051.1 hypothetical protein [Candidatus Micrarchaeota archaeon]